MKLALIMLILILLGLWILETYNKFMEHKTALDHAWKTLNGHLKQRHFLMAQFIELCNQHHIAHEVINKLVAARSAAMGATTVSEKSKTEIAFDQIIKEFLSTINHYQTLCKDSGYASLCQELTKIQSSITSTANAYNNVVHSFNDLVTSFPSKFIASLGHFKRIDTF